jgi:pseudouridine synthase
MTERLQKFLAEAGLGSRRHCEELVRSGRVSVDGRAAELGASVDPDAQEVRVDGSLVTREPKEYWVLNKPTGVLSAVSDNRGRPTVTECVPARARIFPVGRLDVNTTGVMVLTNDGDLTARLLHPRYHVEKEYLVTVHGAVGNPDLERLRRGIILEDGFAVPDAVEVVFRGRSRRGAAATTLSVVIHEGRKRQVRRMFDAAGYRVTALHRSRFDGLTDRGLALGQSRPLSSAEVQRLRHSANPS